MRPSPHRARARSRGGDVGVEGEHRLEPPPALGVVAPHVPEQGQTSWRAAGPPRPCPGAGPVEGDPDVADLGVEQVEPGLLVGPDQLRLGPAGHGDRPRQVGVAQRRLLAGLDQPVAGEVADRLQVAVAGLRAGRCGSRRATGRPAPAAAPARSSCGRASRRAEQTSSAASSVQPPANTDSRRSRVCWPGVSRSWLHSTAASSVWWRAWAGAASLGEQAEAVVEALGDLLDAQGRRARRGQLDGQRDAVEPEADLGQGGGVGVDEAVVGDEGAGPVDEQPGRLVAHQRFDRAIRDAFGRHRQRRHPPDDLAGDAEGLAAGGQHPEHRAGLEQGLDQRRRWPRAGARSCRPRGCTHGRGGGRAGCRRGSGAAAR